jgi:beta-lactamase regulating signal transducer with metallopeptidase domain
MIASWMLYCLLCALGLALAATLAERTLLAGRGPVRHVWIAAVILSFALPALAFRFADRPVVTDAPSLATSHEIALDSILAAWQASPQGTSVVPRRPATKPEVASSWRTIVARTDEPLGMLWLLLSMALSGYLLSGMMALAWLRRGWPRETVLGVPVLVSEHTGPAVLAGLSSAIVVPRWALSMDSPRLALMLRHEQEHQRARDGQLLFAVQLALIAMPWNVALWWQIARLRVAVELDCDARVLRHTDPRTYGDLLLEVVRPGRRSRFMVATAFAEQATQLERRIRVMTRRREMSRGARVAAVTIAFATVTAAWISPRPSRPTHTAAPAAVPAMTVAPADTGAPQRVAVVAADTTHRVAAPKVAQRVSPTPPAPQPVAIADSATPVVLAPRDTPPPNPVINAPVGGRGGRGGGGGRGGVLRDPADVAESVYRRLFDQIALTPSQESSARALLLQLARDERAQADSLMPAIVEFTTKRVAIQAHRDSSLMALLTNDADRATFESHRETPGGGRRGGPPVTALNTQAGGASPGGGRGGGRGVEPSSRPYPIPVAEQVFNRLFDGITLTSDQEKTAFTIIALAVEEQDAVRLPPPRPAILRETPTTFIGSVVALTNEQARASILALLSNDADRATVAARIGVPNTRPPQ